MRQQTAAVIGTWSVTRSARLMMCTIERTSTAVTDVTVNAGVWGSGTSPTPLFSPVFSAIFVFLRISKKRFVVRDLTARTQRIRGSFSYPRTPEPLRVTEPRNQPTTSNLDPANRSRPRVIILFPRVAYFGSDCFLTEYALFRTNVRRLFAD